MAILLVVFAHAMSGVWPSERGLLPAMQSMGGLAGVQLFFVLSGFLITGVLLRGGGLVRFYRRRWHRLYPTLILVVAITVLLTDDAAGGLRALTYTENIPTVGRMTERWDPSQHERWTLGHTWSLAVEEQFYLVWPVLLMVARRHAWKLAAIGIGATWLLQLTVAWSEQAVYRGLRWDAVLAGSLLALVPWSGGRRWFTAGAVVVGAYTLGLVDVGRLDYMVLTVASVTLIASAGGAGWLRAGWLGHLGRISYAWYLWHVVAMRLNLPTPVTLLFGLVLAEVTYLLVDRRAQRPSDHPSPKRQHHAGHHEHEHGHDGPTEDDLEPIVRMAFHTVRL